MQTFTPAAGMNAGRYVGIYQANNYLQIAELQVFGTPAGPPSTVPEPATWVLLGGGVAALGAFARMRRRTNGA